METNIRLYTSPPRESDEWHLMYNKRTSSERCNKRIKLDYLLEAGKHHSTKFWYVRLYLIMMLIHMTSWDLPEESPPQQYIFWGVATTLVCCTILSQFGHFMLCFCFLSFLSSDYAGYSLLIPNAHTQAVFILRFSEFFL